MPHRIFWEIMVEDKFDQIDDDRMRRYRNPPTNTAGFWLLRLVSFPDVAVVYS
jgi:hypothetical protein